MHTHLMANVVPKCVSSLIIRDIVIVHVTTSPRQQGLCSLSFVKLGRLKR